MASFSQYNPGVRSLDFEPKSGALLIGSRGSELYFKKDEAPSKLKPFLQGHYDGEVWGCCISPKKDQFITCGGDKTARLWDAKTNTMLQGMSFDNDVR